MTLKPLALALALLPWAARAQQAAPAAPPVAREFRGVWIATVGNIDWPVKSATPDQQKAALTAMLDQAAALHMNAVIFQVRPAGDAMYASDLEPWSEYLTGTMGKAPSPLYDPLQFAVDEAHKRGLELHAWFNPFRARYGGAKSPLDPRHLAARRPDLVKPYGRNGQMWMDPGEPAVRRHSLDVMLDVVRRYDVDGIHLDDYFYPYKVRDAAGKVMDFPDDASYARYRAGGGRMGRADWRRSNINGFLQTLYTDVKALKPWVKVGISPFGIWRSGTPRGTSGLDPYDELYADSRKWLREGWVDYFTPQLYWAASRPKQSYPVLLKWWAGQNPKQRNVWPGNILSHPAEEIANQVALTRKQSGVSGNVFFSMRGLTGGPKADALRALYAQPALVPASPWLGSTPPGAPSASIGPGGAVSWQPGSGPAPFLWVVQSRTGGAWRTAIVPAATLSWPAPAAPGDIIRVAAVDRLGNLGEPAALEVPSQANTVQ